MSFSCLTPFFDAVQDKIGNHVIPTRYFLGLRQKSPGADLVMFRKDASDKDGNPRGGGFIFHYNGYNGGMGGDIPQRAPVNNLRNTLLFEVLPEEYKAVEAQVDMMCANAQHNPYYFSRSLSPIERYERKGQMPIDFLGNDREDVYNYPTELAGLAADFIPFTAVNCVHLAIQTLQHIGNIDLSEIDPDFGSATRGSEYDAVFDNIKDRYLNSDLAETSMRTILIFDEHEQLLKRRSTGAFPVPELIGS